MSLDGPGLSPTTSNVYNNIVGKTQRRHRLLSVHWELTYRCNEKCTHCYLDVFAPHAEVPGELTTDDCFRVIDELAELGALNLTLSGGEILVRRDFFEIAQYARAKKFLLRLYTNGILIKPDIADKIADLHPYAVEISVYGASPETHDRITQLNRSHELTVRALKLLRERGIRTVMKTPLMHENVYEFEALKTLARDLNAQFRYDITITPKNDGSHSPFKHRMTNEDLLWLFRQEVEPSEWVSRVVPMEYGTCGISLNGLAIDPYGFVFPCLEARIAAGNLRDKPLKELWYDSPLWSDLSHLTLGELPVCRTCELRNLCVRCHGLAMEESGDLTAPAIINCREALARRQVLVEKGALPADFPIPAHLRAFANDSEIAGDQLSEPLTENFIPLSAIGISPRPVIAMAN